MTRVVHKEMVCDVLAGAVNTFHTDQVAINPGMSECFPWVSGIANQFELYRFARLSFFWVPRMSTLTPGSVSLAVDFDALDPAPASKQDMMSYSCSVTESLWREFRLDVPVASLSRFARERYTRKGATTVSDAKTYDIGTLFIAARCSEPLNTVLGELYVDYDLELIEPQVRVNSTLTGQATHPAAELDAPWLYSVGTQAVGQIHDLFAPDQDAGANGQKLVVLKPFEGLLQFSSFITSGGASDLSWSLYKLAEDSISTMIQTVHDYAAGGGVWSFAVHLQKGDKIKLTHTVAGAIGAIALLATGCSLRDLGVLMNPTSRRYVGYTSVFDVKQPTSPKEKGEMDRYNRWARTGPDCDSPEDGSDT